MRKKLISLLATILLLLLSFYLIGCSRYKSSNRVNYYNLIVFNNSKEGINSFGYKEKIL